MPSAPPTTQWEGGHVSFLGGLIPSLTMAHHQCNRCPHLLNLQLLPSCHHCRLIVASLAPSHSFVQALQEIEFQEEQQTQCLTQSCGSDEKLFELFLVTDAYYTETSLSLEIKKANDEWRTVMSSQGDTYASKMTYRKGKCLNGERRYMARAVTNTP
jgi:hypothetical protein